ncbi:hypothetical protein [Sorangium sp. So ce117]|uniref:hypothetical protein n=1 Tax=Sorangium sp. So ce117 TaxID=3133277 RepID=UPI003F5E2E64
MRSTSEKSPAERRSAFYKAWEEHKKAGFAATQEEANRIAAEHGIEPVKLPEPEGAVVVHAPRGRGSMFNGGGGLGIF